MHSGEERLSLRAGRRKYVVLRPVNYDVLRPCKKIVVGVGPKKVAVSVIVIRVSDLLVHESLFDFRTQDFFERYFLRPHVDHVLAGHYPVLDLPHAESNASRFFFVKDSHRGYDVSDDRVLEVVYDSLLRHRREKVFYDLLRHVRTPGEYREF